MAISISSPSHTIKVAAVAPSMVSIFEHVGLREIIELNTTFRGVPVAIAISVTTVELEAVPGVVQSWRRVSRVPTAKPIERSKATYIHQLSIQYGMKTLL